MNIANGKHCTRIVQGHTVECYRQAVAEYRMKNGAMVARLCRQHDNKIARDAAETLHLTRVEL